MIFKIIRLFFLFYIPIFLVTLVSLRLQYYSRLENQKELESRSAAYRAELLSDMQQRMIYNVDFWSQIVYPDHFSPTGKDSLFMQPYIHIMKGISDYYQFRYLDTTGQEVLRIERNPKTGKFSEGKLQNKAGRNYFEKGIDLNKGEIYLSEINLNRENGKLVRPLLPVMRALAPIYSKSGVKLGVVVINFNLTNFLKRLKAKLTNSNFYLVDQDLNIISTNAFLKGLDYELEDSEILNGDYQLDEMGLNEIEGDTSFVDSGVLWAVKEVNLTKDYGSLQPNYDSNNQVKTADNWAIIHQIPQNRLNEILWPLYRNLLIINGLAFVLILVCCYAVVKKQNDKQLFYKELDSTNERLKHKRETLKATNEALISLNLRLEKRNQQLEEFNYLVSHNLRAPITSMSLIVELISETQSLEELNNLTPKLYKIATNIADITEDIQEYVTILNNKQVTLEEFSIETVIENVKSDFAELLLNQINFEISYDFEAWDMLHFSKFYFKSVVQNLMSNAIKYRREHVSSYLSFRTAIEDGAKVLYVKDNGRGINLDRHRAHIFKLYKRFHRDISGKGMGLFIVKSQLESLDAEITVSSKEQEGSEFRIKFN